MPERKTVTIRSTSKARFYAVNECTKSLLQLFRTLDDLHLSYMFLNTRVHIYNDNNACICWSHNLTKKRPETCIDPGKCHPRDCSKRFNLCT